MCLCKSDSVKERLYVQAVVVVLKKQLSSSCVCNGEHVRHDECKNDGDGDGDDDDNDAEKNEDDEDKDEDEVEVDDHDDDDGDDDDGDDDDDAKK